MQEDLLGPDRVGLLVQKVRDEASEWTEERVHKSEHRSPVRRSLKSKVGNMTFEIDAVVGSKNTVDGQLSTEGTEVASACDDSLGREADFGDLCERGLLDHLALGGVKHLLLAHLRFVVVERAAGVVKLLLFVDESAWG